MKSEQLRWLPNALTFLRIALVVPFAGALLQGSYRLSLLIFLVAAVTDALDGFLARFFNWRSRLGAIADPLADKSLLIVAYLMLTITGVIPIWLFTLVLGRDLVIVAGALAYHYGVGRYDMAPSLVGKLNTLIQVVIVLAMMVFLAGWPMPAWVMTGGIWLVAAAALVSGGHYVFVWSVRAWRAKRL